MLRFFAAPEAVPVSSFRAAFEAVRDGSAAAAVVPVESSLLGTIRENLDLLWEFELPIVGEVSCRSGWRCSRAPGERLETIKRVYSISAALAQADAFLRSRPWTVQTSYNTAGAARQVAERGRAGRGRRGLGAGRGDLRARGARRRHPVGHRQPHAVRGHRRVRARGGRVRGAGRRAPEAVAGPPRTSLAFAVRNVPGSLYRSLGAFATRGLNLSRLESRPWTARGVALGVPVLGRPRRRPGGPGLRRGPRGAARRDRGRADPGHVPARPGGLTADRPRVRRTSSPPGPGGQLPGAIASASHDDPPEDRQRRRPR